MSVPKNEATAQVAEFLKILTSPGDVVEVRILNAPGAGTVAGYFNNFEKLASAVAQWEGKASIYVTLNPVNPALLARAANKIVVKPKHTTADGDITARRWFLIDLDPVRPAGIAASDEEKATALGRVQEIYRWLKECGWPEPLVADSGNGYYLLYRVDLANDNAARDLIRDCLLALALRFDDHCVAIDTSVFNAARIIRLIGTVNCKGDNTPERPHRRSRLLRVPQELVPVPPEKLRELAASAPKPQFEPRAAGEGGFDVQAWLANHGLPVVQRKPWAGGGTVWVLNPCPMNETHTNKSAFVVRFANGAIAAGCHHNSCQHWGWRELREKFEPQDCAKNATKERRKNRHQSTNLQNATGVVVNLSNLELEEISWLWEPYIPRRKLTLISGDPERGKTWVAVAICAKATKEGHNVLYCTAEDGLADTILARAIACGADLTRFFALKEVKTESGLLVPFTLDHAGVLEEAIKTYKPVLVVLDPVQGFLSPEVDMYRANQVRQQLVLLMRLAEDYDCAILIVGHLNKNLGTKGSYRALGSIDFIAAARSQLIVASDRDGRRVLAHQKSNLAERGKSLLFTIEKGQFLWCGETETTAEELLAVCEEDGDEKSKLNEAVEWLSEMLAGGAVESKEVYKQADAAGISKRTLWRAKAQLKVKVTRKGEEGQRGKGTWLWSLPCQPDGSALKKQDGNLNPESQNTETTSDSGHGLRLPNDNLNPEAQDQESRGVSAMDLGCQSRFLEQNETGGNVNSYIGSLEEFEA